MFKMQIPHQTLLHFLKLKFFIGFGVVQTVKYLFLLEVLAQVVTKDLVSSLELATSAMAISKDVNVRSTNL